MTQRQLADYLGLSSQQISNYESDRQRIPRVVVLALGRASLSFEEQTFLDRYASQLLEKLPQQIVFMVVFGSKIRGEATADSDLDLLIVVQKKTVSIRDQIFKILFDLDPVNRHNVSPLVYSLSEFHTNERLGAPFIGNIKRDGILL